MSNQYQTAREDECLLLGILLVAGAEGDTEPIEKVSSIISPGAFVDASYQDNQNSRIFQAMRAVKRSDQISVARELNTSGTVRSGDIAFMSHLVSDCPGDLNYEYYANLVAQYSDDRANGLKPDETIPPELSRSLTDFGNAERLIAMHGSKLRYCYERKRWLVWSGKFWDWDMGAKITALAKRTVRNIYREAAEEPDDKKRKEFADHAKRSESDSRINAMINLAQSEEGIPVKVGELDANHWLFNCQNGTLDLKTGGLLPHNKGDFITRIVSIEYSPDALAPRWQAFLDQITNGDTDLIAYLQRAVGYSLTGDTKSQILFFLYGLGNNGKSTFVTTIRRLVGEYGDRVSTDLFMLKDKNASGPKEALANLKGKRFVVASELEDGRRLAVSLIKDLTGGETIKADRKYEHEVEYTPTHKIWLVGNHKPIITDTTLSIWRRMKLIPFTVTIANKDIDPDLQVKLEAELPGVLAWAVRGCLDWQEYGPAEPAVVTSATALYRHDQDILGDWLEDCCVVEPLISIPKTDLKESYQQWCKDNGIEPITQRTFKARLVEKGITEGRIGKARLWTGIRLRTPEDDDNSNESLVTEVRHENDKSLENPGTEVTRGDVSTGVFTRRDSKEKFKEHGHLLSQTPQFEANDENKLSQYPTESCMACGSNYYLGEDGKWHCEKCPPVEKQSDGEEKLL